MRPQLPAAAALAALLLAGASAAQEPGPLGPSSASIRIETTSVAVGVGVSWGQGTLSFRDKVYEFRVSGLSLASLGVSRVVATGEVWFLEKLEDFPGTFSGVDAAVAVGAGGGGLALRNPKGVYMKLRSSQRGAKLALSTGTLEIELVDPGDE